MFNPLCYSLLRDSTAAAQVAGASAPTQPAAVGSVLKTLVVAGCCLRAWYLSVIIRVLFY